MGRARHEIKLGQYSEPKPSEARTGASPGMAAIAGAAGRGGAKALAAGTVTGRDEAAASTGADGWGAAVGAGVATTVTVAGATCAGALERATTVVATGAAGTASRRPGRSIGNGAEAMVIGAEAATGAAATGAGVGAKGLG